VETGDDVRDQRPKDIREKRDHGENEEYDRDQKSASAASGRVLGGCHCHSIIAIRQALG
jgi:hypothetical protein